MLADRTSYRGDGRVGASYRIDSSRGLTPEAIAADRPQLPLAKVFAAPAWYHVNQAGMNGKPDDARLHSQPAGTACCLNAQKETPHRIGH
jgi:hypothetical protein